MITTISFCILNYGHSEDSLRRCIESIKMQSVPAYEILICGSKCMHPDVISLEHQDWAQSGQLNKMRNLLCTRASNELVVLMDANVELTSDWYSNIKEADCFDLTACRLIDSSGQRVVDWAYSSVKKDAGDRAIPLHYDEWNPRGYVSGILMLVRRCVWERIKFNEDYSLNEGDDADFCLRTSEIGFRTGVFEQAVAIYHYDNKTYNTRTEVTFNRGSRISLIWNWFRSFSKRLLSNGSRI